jgi:hypothetical protein
VRIPEAHCYLRVGAVRVDLTRSDVEGEPIERFLVEEEIVPEQIGSYKQALHQEVLRRWAQEQDVSYEAAQQVRELSIAALAQVSAAQPALAGDEPASTFS